MKDPYQPHLEDEIEKMKTALRAIASGENSFFGMMQIARAALDHLCQRCGAPTNGEEALVGDQIWCHPCADEESKK